MAEPVIVQTASGCAHTVMLRSDGTVWVAVPPGRPKRVEGLRDVIAVGAGSIHTLALKGDGSLWAWGMRGSDGQPVTIPAFIGVLADLPALTPVLCGPLAVPNAPRLHFGSGCVGKRRPVASLELTNLGLDPLRVTRVELRGEHAGDFRMVGEDCSGVEIYPSSRCNLDLAFRPGGPGWREAEMAISVRGGARPVSVTLVGHGSGAEISCDNPTGLPIQVEASGCICHPRIRCGRQELVGGAGCEHTLRQEFIIEVPVAVDAVACCDGSGSGTQRCKEFTLTESVWVDLPVTFGAYTTSGRLSEPSDGAADCSFVLRRKVCVALPIACGAESGC